ESSTNLMISGWTVWARIMRMQLARKSGRLFRVGIIIPILIYYLIINFFTVNGCAHSLLNDSDHRCIPGFVGGSAVKPAEEEGFTKYIHVQDHHSPGIKPGIESLDEFLIGELAAGQLVNHVDWPDTSLSIRGDIDLIPWIYASRFFCHYMNINSLGSIFTLKIPR